MYSLDHRHLYDEGRSRRDWDLAEDDPGDDLDLLALLNRRDARIREVEELRDLWHTS
jgi:hypothetical protein